MKDVLARVPLNRKQIERSLLIIACLFLSFYVFFIPPSEADFVRKIGNAFNKSSNDVVLIKDVTDFEWDSVCFIGKNWIIPFKLDHRTEADKIEYWLRRDPAPFVGNIDNTMMPTYHGAYYFIKNNQIVHKYSFNTLGLRVIERRIAPYYVFISIQGTRYFFLIEHNMLNDSCANYEDAAFRRQQPPQIREPQIFFTNLSTEKKISTRKKK